MWMNEAVLNCSFSSPSANMRLSYGAFDLLSEPRVAVGPILSCCNELGMRARHLLVKPMLFIDSDLNRFSTTKVEDNSGFGFYVMEHHVLGEGNCPAR